MNVFVLMDPLYENPVGAYSTDERATSEMDRLNELGKETRGTYGYSVYEFEMDAPADPEKARE